MIGDLMKKFAAFLLCFVLLFSFCACECEYSDFLELFQILQTNDTKPIPTDYSEMIGIYRDIIRVCQTYFDGKDADDSPAYELGILDRCDKELYDQLFLSAYLFYPGRGQGDWTSPHYKLRCGYAIKDLNRDGIDELVLLNDDYTVVAFFSMADQTPVLLGNYRPRNTCVIDGEGLVHKYGSNGASNNSHAVYRIVPGGASLELIVEFGVSGFVWENDVAVSQYYKLDGELATDITKEEYDALCKEWRCCDLPTDVEQTHNCAALTFTPLFTENEIAMEAYQNVLQVNTMVYDTDSRSHMFLGDFQLPYLDVTIGELDSLQHAYVDIDGDSADELIIDCGDTVILRHYEGTVYLYAFPFRNLYDLNTDGSYAWTQTGDGLSYGQNQLVFDSVTAVHKQLWKIVNDGEPHAEYYVGEQQVTKQQLDEYIAKHPKTKIDFSPFELLALTPKQAISIAEAYWEKFDIEKNGYLVDQGSNYRAEDSLYVIRLRKFVEGHYTTIDEVWIDKFTGQVVIPHEYGK